MPTHMNTQVNIAYEYIYTSYYKLDTLCVRPRICSAAYDELELNQRSTTCTKDMRVFVFLVHLFWWNIHLVISTLFLVNK